MALSTMASSSSETCSSISSYKYSSFAILLTYSKCFQFNENNLWAIFFSLSSHSQALMRRRGCHYFVVVSHSLSINIFFAFSRRDRFGGLKSRNVFYVPNNPVYAVIIIFCWECVKTHYFPSMTTLYSEIVI